MNGASSGVTVTIVLLLLAIIAQTVTWPRTATGECKAHVFSQRNQQLT